MSSSIVESGWSGAADVYVRGDVTHSRRALLRTPSHPLGAAHLGRCVRRCAAAPRVTGAMLQLRCAALRPCVALPVGRARRLRAVPARARAACVAAAGESRGNSGARLRASCAALAAACLLAASPPAALAEVCTAAGVCSEGAVEELGDFAQILRDRSAANKADNDQRRLDNFYKREWRINKILRADALPEPCDPRQPEFSFKCRPNAGLRSADELR